MAIDYMGAAASIGSNLMDLGARSVMSNSANAKSKRAAKFAFAAQNYFMDKQNEYNEPINQMKRLRKAGLNPNLVYENGNAVIASASPGGGIEPNVTPASGSFDVIGKMQAIKSLEQQQAGIDNTEAQTRAIDVNLELKRQEIAQRKQLNDLRLLVMGEQIKRFGVQNEKTLAELNYLRNKFDWRNPNDLKLLPIIIGEFVKSINGNLGNMNGGDSYETL